MTQTAKEVVAYLKKRYDINISTTNYLTNIIDAIMTDREKLKKALIVIKTLKQDAKLALSGAWNKSDDGFEDQITLIDMFFNEIRKDDEEGKKFRQTKLPL